MNGFESGRYSTCRVKFSGSKSPDYLIYTTSDENGVNCVGVITRPHNRLWRIMVDGKVRGMARTLKLAKELASEILDSPAKVGAA